MRKVVEWIREHLPGPRGDDPSDRKPEADDLDERLAGAIHAMEEQARLIAAMDAANER